MKIQRLSILGLGVFCIAMLGNTAPDCVCWSAEPDDEQPQLEFILQGDRDHLELNFMPEAATVTVHSPRGIGRVTVNRKDGPWPELMSFRLHLAELEGLTVTTTDRQLNTFLGSDRTEVRVRNEETGRWDEREEGDYRISVQREEESEVIIAELPAALFNDDLRSFQLQWVDYYRN